MACSKHAICIFTAAFSADRSADAEAEFKLIYKSWTGLLPDSTLSDIHHDVKRKYGCDLNRLTKEQKDLLILYFKEFGITL